MTYLTISIKELLIPVTIKIFLVLVTMLVTQFIFIKAKTSQVLPSFISVSIVLAILASIFILNKKINIIQILGIVFVIIGIIFLTAFREEEKS